MARAQERLAPEAPFHFVGGDPSLDFVNTADWTPRGLERDRFTSYQRLLEWALGAGVLGPAEVRRLRRAAEHRPGPAAAAVEAARAARRVLRDVFASVAAGQRGGSRLEGLNTLLAAAATHLRLVRDRRGHLVRGWADPGTSLDWFLRPVAWSAGTLLSSDEVAKLRMCAGHDCGWLYVDRSRNGLRRWCEMDVCGTAEKNRRRARREAET